jgi:fatty acid desaturase
MDTDATAESATRFGGPSFMPKIARRVGIVVRAFVLAWLAAALLAGWLFGSGNILVWVIAAVVGITVYFLLAWRERRVGQTPQ